jgi:hypothetical protein
MIGPCVCRTANGYWVRVHVRPLTDDEGRWADSVGDERFRRAKASGWKDYLGAASADSHRLGARGELAFCIATGTKWGATLSSFRDSPDVEPDFEIRTGRRPFLKLRPDDPTDRRTRDRRYVLLTPSDPAYRDAHLPDGASFDIHGWLRGTEATGEPMTDPGNRGRPAFFVPDDRLHRLPFDAKHVPPKIVGETAQLGLDNLSASA